MTKVVPFEIEDLEGFVPRWKMPGIEVIMQDNLDNPLREMVSLVDDKGMFAIVGSNILRKHVVEVWIVPSLRVNEHKFFFYKTIRTLVYGYLMSKQSFKRVEFTIKADWPEGLKWGKALGFEREGLLRKWDGEDDHVLFAKVI